LFDGVLADAFQQQDADLVLRVGRPGHVWVSLERRFRISQNPSRAAAVASGRAGPAAGRLGFPLASNPPMTDPRLESLRPVPPGLQLECGPAELEHFGRDWTRRWTPAPLAIAFPRQAQDVVGIVQWARREGVVLVPSGGRTGLSGGAVAANGGLVVSLERMNRILGFDPIDRTLTVQAGTPLEAVQNAARERGLAYPVDFAARGSCSIGGNIASNDGGIR